MKVTLASSSPRRKDLLSLLLADFDCCSPNIDETVRSGESPAKYVARLAREKSLTVDSPGVVIAADTTVARDDIILGKPSNRDEAKHMLATLSGTSHQVHTALAMRNASAVDVCVVSSNVTFLALSDHLIEQYLNTDEAWDKAGSYGIQGLAGSFVAHLEGDYSAVVGLPLGPTREMLARFGVTLSW